MKKYCGTRRAKYFKIVCGLLILALPLTSCVYFNTFYNARKYFESAQGYQVPESGRPPARAIQDYEKVIEKCTYILNEHPNSKWADDALFLLARSLFYQRRNIMQARERFNDMLRVFPESKFIPESKIYLARVERHLNNYPESIRILTEILNEQQFAPYHSRVLLLKSSWHLEEKDIKSAQEDLNRLIEDYPNSKEFEEAYLKLGTSYLDEGNYAKSKELFESLLARRVARRIRFDARYYVTLSNFYLKEYDVALEQINSLISDEYETALFARLYLLKARIKAAQKNYVEAEDIFKKVIEDYRRSLFSAEASFYLAEMFFIDLGDYENAIKYYSNVSSEFRTSPLVQKAMGRSSVVSQLMQLSDEGQTLSTQQLVQEHFKLAEYYLYEMNLPDSALSVYANIERQKGRLKDRHQRLKTQMAKIDTLDAKDSLPDDEPEADKKTNEIAVYPSFEDGSWEEPLLEGTLFNDHDEIEDIAADSVDSKVKDSVVSELNRLSEEIKTVEEAIILYEKKYVPYSYFLSAWIWLNEKEDREKASAILVEMKERFPDNRYIYALEQLINGKPVNLAHPVEIRIEESYEQAIKIMQTDKSTGLNILRELKDEIEQEMQRRHIEAFKDIRELYNRVLYTIGFSYYFDLSDSTAARDYFDELLAQAPGSRYSENIKTFYKNNIFIVTDSLSTPQQEEQEDRLDGTEPFIPEVYNEYTEPDH